MIKPILLLLYSGREHYFKVYFRTIDVHYRGKEEYETLTVGLDMDIYRAILFL